MQTGLVANSSEADPPPPGRQDGNIRLSALIASMQAAVLVEDEQRRVVLANQAFCDMFAIPVPPEHLIGMDCAASAEQSKAMFADPDGFVRRIDVLLAAREPVNAERVLLADGRIFERDYVPVFFESQYGGHLWQYRDVSERERLTAELIRARDDAQSADRAKSAFLSMISHEIRTPLNAIIGMAGLLLDTELDGEQRGYSRAIRSSGDILLALLNNVLDFSKIEAGHIQIEHLPFSPREAVEDCIALLDPSARERGLSLRAVIDPHTAAYVRGDLQRVRQVLINLLSNAIKFTETGTIVLHLRTLPIAGGVELECTVIDSGLGMSAAQIGQLFQPFQQASAAVANASSGAGLGLVLSKRLTDLMGGTLSVQSIPGQGSTFSLRIPTIEVTRNERRPAPVHSRPHREAQRSMAGVPLSGMQVLVAEDNLLNQQVLLRLLSRSGYQADVASDGQAALDAILTGNYDLVFMDIHMPELDGLSVTQKVRVALSAERQPFIVAVTAGSLSGDRERYLAAGMDEYLSKPIQRNELESVLIRAAAGSLFRSDPDSILLDPAMIAELLTAIGGEEGLASLVELFQYDIGNTLLQLRNHALSGAFEQVAELAHRLKGSGLTLGAERFVLACRSVESFKHSHDGTGLLAAIDQLDRIYAETLAALQAKLRST